MKPTILLIGDSICMGYRPLVQQYLIDKVHILGIPENGGDSANLLRNIDEWMINPEADLLHINCGLHDLKFFRDTRTYQQSCDIYANNLRTIIKKLQGAKKQVVWATTTPVIDERHNAIKEFNRYEKDVERYNSTAYEIMLDAGIIINDLHSVIMNNDIGTCLMPDGVHMTTHGNQLLARAVSDFMLKYFNIELNNNN
ncbi:MAG: hypothetical protein A2Y62_01515 [Candidatus Fischerbacteria bacterium RBG_13_37_8]|uniref:SGNH hydrolase-type esterase domain-containing protein n=1 Tax=Candidatus Fischerbacteria bacterium RBG_13_37_8 TaxID=1817863 RepID=A0A1F5VTV9_9BACT|nr:MAG: hypothetical protein A2Y62_01515 [Candidatus Fischerbacteria bacterium RBG_13_37_8]